MRHGSDRARPPPPQHRHHRGPVGRGHGAVPGGRQRRPDRRRAGRVGHHRGASALPARGVAQGPAGREGVLRGAGASYGGRGTRRAGLRSGSGPGPGAARLCSSCPRTTMRWMRSVRSASRPKRCASPQLRRCATPRSGATTRAEAFVDRCAEGLRLRGPFLLGVGLIGSGGSTSLLRIGTASFAFVRRPRFSWPALQDRFAAIDGGGRRYTGA